MAGSIYNRLSRPVAVIGHRTAFIQLCKLACVDPHNNDLFVRVASPEDVHGTVEFSRVLEIEGAAETEHYNFVRSKALSRVRNEARARKDDPRAV